MKDFAQRALLPAGLRDSLPPHAAFEAAVMERLMAEAAAYGYERVKPPLVEFEDTLLGNGAAGMTAQTFRLMDPVSQKMLAVRSDITLQVARIATTRLSDLPRPLRLSYAGPVLRVKGTQLRPEREFAQVGVELIGSDSVAADAEIIVLAAAALEAAGVKHLSVDLNLSALVPAVFAALDLRGPSAAKLRAALDRKDAAAVESAGGEAARLLGALLAAAGPAEGALAALAAIDLPPAAAAERARLACVVRQVAAQTEDLILTVDPVENRGFEYHVGVGFTFFSLGVRGELGRGGRYLAGAEPGEPATGCTLFMDTVVRALPEPEAGKRLFLPFGTPPATARRLRGQGWVTLQGLGPAADAAAEARRLGCSHLWDDEVKGL